VPGSARVPWSALPAVRAMRRAGLWTRGEGLRAYARAAGLR
jgi:hypothetical protein